MLMQQLLTLKPPVTEQTAGKFVLALLNTGTDSLVGYYVSDDEDVSKSVKKALKYNTKAEAEADAKLCNNQWDLHRQRFVVRSLEQLVRERYEDTIDFDDDMGKLIDHLEEALKICESANFKQHMKDTDQNFLTDAVQIAKDMSADISTALKSARDLYDYLTDEAS